MKLILGEDTEDTTVLHSPRKLNQVHRYLEYPLISTTAVISSHRTLP